MTWRLATAFLVLTAAALCCDIGSYQQQKACIATVPDGTHAIAASSDSEGNCTLECAGGFYDCNKVIADGCEHAGPCPTGPSFDSGVHVDAGLGVELLAQLGAAPNGLVACADRVYYFDGSTLVEVDPAAPGAATILTASATTPAGGIACDGNRLFWPAQIDGDAGGNVFAWDLVSHALSTISSSVDPARGIDTQSSSVYWIARSGFADAGAMLVRSDDAGASGLSLVGETGTYKPFSITSSVAFAVNGFSVNAIAQDGGVTAYAFDAGPRAAFAGTSPLAYVVVPSANGDAIVRVDLPEVDVASGLPPIVATASYGDLAIVASAENVYAVHLSAAKVALVAGPFIHVTDVATDGARIYWLTRGEASTPAALWTALVP